MCVNLFQSVQGINSVWGQNMTFHVGSNVNAVLCYCIADCAVNVTTTQHCMHRTYLSMKQLYLDPKFYSVASTASRTTINSYKRINFHKSQHTSMTSDRINHLFMLLQLSPIYVCNSKLFKNLQLINS